MSDTTERARDDAEIVREMIHRANRESQLLDGREYDTRVFEEAYAALDRLLAKRDALAAELAAAEKRNAELERRLAVLDSPHLFDAIRAITNLSQNDVELAIRAVRIAMDMAQAGHDAGVAALAAASEGKP